MVLPPSKRVKGDPLAQDFRVFMKLVWNETGLPDPTPMQYLFGDTLQKSNDPRLCLLGFRGFAKTLIAAIYLLWRLYCDPSLQIAIWGSNESNAGATTAYMLKLIEDIPWLSHLAPQKDQSESKLSFDVAGRGHFRGNSVMAFGIGGSVTGTRADILLVDDPETSSNGDTSKRRAAIDRAMQEAGFVVKKGGRIIVLGTIHFDDSVYLRMMAWGYKFWIFPMAVPDEETQKACWPYYLAPVRRLMETLPYNSPLDRFGPDEISLRQRQGLLSFSRQCICNPFRTSLSQKPFNLRQIIVYQANREKLPVRFTHTQDDHWLDEEAMNYSSAALTDKLYRPSSVDPMEAPYDRIVAVVDPAGTGTDEVALAILGVCMGYVVLFHIEGMTGGAKDDNLDRILEVSRRYKVEEIQVESNFGQDLFGQFLHARQMAQYAKFGPNNNIVPVTSKHASKKKERRIIQALDPVINSGKLIITRDALVTDYESANVHTSDDRMIYRLTYQLSYFSDGGNQLEKDDRIDVLASGIELLKDFLVDHPDNAAKSWDDRIIEEAFGKDQSQFERDRGIGLDREPLRARKSYLSFKRSA